MAAPLPRPRRAVAADAAQMAYVAESAYSPYLERMGGLRPGPTGRRLHRGRRRQRDLVRVFYEKRL